MALFSLRSFRFDCIVFFAFFSFSLRYCTDRGGHFNERLGGQFGRRYWQTSHLSCWIDCQKIEKGACFELWMPPLNAAPRAVSKTGLGSVIAALDAEFWATM